MTCRTAGPWCCAGAAGASAQRRGGESQFFLANYLGKTPIQVCFGGSGAAPLAGRGQSRDPPPRALGLGTFRFSVRDFGPRPKATAMLSVAQMLSFGFGFCLVCFF